jgi:glycosyltransferase involved in cell wall biosynthesis
VKLLYITDQKLPRKATDTDQFMAMVSAFGENSVEITLLSSKYIFSKKASVEDLVQFFSIKPNFRHETLSSQLFGLRFFEKPLHGILTLFSREFWQSDFIYSRSLNNIIPALLFSNKSIFLETYKTLPDNSIFLRPLLWMLKKKSNFKGIITHSNYAAQSFIRFGFKPNQVQVHHNGIDFDILKPELTKDEARKKLDLPENAFIFTYSGTVSMNKGLDLILPIAEKIPQITFIIIGSKGNGEFEKRAKNHPTILIKPWVKQSDLIPYLYASDCLFIPPSEKPLKVIGNTVLPIKTFIYMASGRPIIAPNSADLRELLIHNKNALLVEPGNSTEFIEAINCLYNDRDLSNELAREAKQQMNSNSWKKRAESILSYCIDRMS